MKALVVCKHPEGSEEAQACRIIKKEGLDIIYSWKNTLSKKDLENIDLIIAIGGDGTALSASHFITDKPILAINSSPSTSEGALTSIPLERLEEKLDEILAGKAKEEKHERIEISINNKPIDNLALNEVFIGNEKSYLISRYVLKYNEKEEKQLSSGLIFSTGTGSAAWFKSAGGTPFKPADKFIKMIIREPYSGRLNKSTLNNLIIKENEEIEIIPLVNSILAVDSIREFHLNQNDKVRIKISPHPLRKII